MMIQVKREIEIGLNKTVKDEWSEFSKKIFAGFIPNQTQREETEKAFYAGFYSCLSVCLFQVTEHETEEAGAAFLENLRTECDNFFKQKLKDYLNSKN